MKLIDTDTINYILVNKKSFEDECFVTPDVNEEMLVAEMVHSKKVPVSIKQLIFGGDFDEADYLKNYYEALNQYSKRSFFNMKGFGDVSIVAAAHTIINSKKSKPSVLPLPGFVDEIEVYTGDTHLSKYLKKKFNGDIKIFNKTDI